MNYFEFFSLPLSPRVDQAALKRQFYANSRKYHPDFFTLESAEKQAEALELSTLNNQAYKVLRDDDQRLKYLLELKGVLGEEGTNQVPQDFLMDVMEINEALMELEFDDDPAVRKQTTHLTEALEQTLKAEVATIIDNYQDQSVTAAELNQLRDYYLKRRYLLRIREKL